MARGARVEVSGEVLHETDDAYRFTDGSKITWLPKSQCTFVPDNPHSDTGVMTMPEWLAMDRGLI